MRMLKADLKAAARVICGPKKFDHITAILKELHWLPVSYRISFKIALIAYKRIEGQAPA